MFAEQLCLQSKENRENDRTNIHRLGISCGRSGYDKVKEGTLTKNCSFAIIFFVTKLAPVAQGIERRFPKPQVGRSIRLGRTSTFRLRRNAESFVLRKCYVHDVNFSFFFVDSTSEDFIHPRVGINSFTNKCI